MRGEWGELRGLSQRVQLSAGVQINFGALTPYSITPYLTPTKVDLLIWPQEVTLESLERAYESEEFHIASWRSHHRLELAIGTCVHASYSFLIQRGTEQNSIGFLWGFLTIEIWRRERELFQHSTNRGSSQSSIVAAGNFSGMFRYIMLT